MKGWIDAIQGMWSEQTVIARSRAWIPSALLCRGERAADPSEVDLAGANECVCESPLPRDGVHRLSETTSQSIQHAGQTRDVVEARENEADQTFPRLLANQTKPPMILNRSVNGRVDIDFMDERREVYIQREKISDWIGYRSLKSQMGIPLSDRNERTADPTEEGIVICLSPTKDLS